MQLLRRISVLVACAALLCGHVLAQEGKDRDKLVRLMSAKTVRVFEMNGKPFRIAEGPARFLHNDTWLICDTALWDVDAQIIHATGNVRIEQENTELSSDSLVYIVHEDLAKFRGALVQLRDKDNNTLRTHFLDYNTKDSIAVFKNGGAMRDKDGQLIESTTGTYDSKAKLFTFLNNVNMFTDSVFVKTSQLIYQSDSSLATYPNYVEVWKESNMMSAHRGWYDKQREKFFFRDNVHALTDIRECWCDTLYYMRDAGDAEMFGHVQVTDTTRNIHTLSGEAYYCDSLRRLTLLEDPLVITIAKEEGRRNRRDADGRYYDASEDGKDSVFFRSDVMVYQTFRKCDIAKNEIDVAQKRVDEISVDAIANIRAKAAEEAAKAAKEAMEREIAAGQRAPGKLDTGSKNASDKDEDDEDVEKTPAPSKAEIDSLKAAALAADTTDVGFLLAHGKVKMFRRNTQIVCDSLRYSDLDSLIRLFKNPIVWNDRRHQYNADSLYLVVRKEKMERAHLLSNAFIHIQEEDNFYDQIRGAEMVAHFDDSTQLKRFDAMGSVTALFFMKEKEKVATANRKETTIMSANFKNGEIHDITYFENPKSDAYPIAQMKSDEKTLKGYNWQPDIRPKRSADITSLKPRKPERAYYESRPRAEFAQTEIYFKGYMAQVYRQIERSDSLRKVNERKRELERKRKAEMAKMEAQMQADSLKNAVAADSLATAAADSSAVVAPVDSLAVGVNNIADSLGVVARTDSLGVAADSLGVTTDSAAVAKVLTARELKKLELQKKREAKAAERKARMEAREKALEEKWAAQDARDAAKKAARDAKKAARKHKHEQDVLRRTLNQKKKEDAMLERYRQKLIREAEKGRFKNLAPASDAVSEPE